MNKAIVCVLLLGTWVVFPAEAQETPPANAGEKAPAESGGDGAELAAIRQQAEAFVAAFNKGDAKAAAALWTEDGQYSDGAGQVIRGREAIEEAYHEFFTEHPGAELTLQPDSLQLLGSGTAMEDGQASVARKAGEVADSSSYTAVHVKVGGKWLMATVRETPITPSPTASAAADLAWLVGTWITEEHGLRTESVCDWVAAKSFLERRHTTTSPDGSTSSGVQIIGWNPQGNHVQSWNFTSDGGHAVGVWMPIEGGWQANIVGTTGDGTPTAAVNVLRRLDDNAYAWQSVQRCLGEAALPDTDEIVIRRLPTAN